MIRRIAIAVLAIIVLLPSAADAAPGANQLVPWSGLCSEVTAGRFVWKAGTPAQCSSLPNRITSWADFTGAVNSSGCAAGNPLPTYQLMINCRVLIGLVSASVSGSAEGPVPCNAICISGGGSPTPASPLDTQTSSTTVNPVSAGTQISWNVTPSSVSGTCSLSLKYGSTIVVTAVGLTQGVASTGSYSLGGGAGVYTLHIACSTNGSSATVSGTLSWYQ